MLGEDPTSHERTAHDDPDDSQDDERLARLLGAVSAPAGSTTAGLLRDLRNPGVQGESLILLRLQKFNN